MVKIGIDGQTFSVPNPSGTVRTGIEMTKALNQIHSDLAVFGHTTVSNRLSGLPVHSYGYNWNSRAFGILWGQTFLPKQAADLDVDVLYSPVTYCPLVLTTFPCAITIHDLSSFQGHSAGWYNWFERIVVPKMAARADLIFTVSEFSKSKICSKLEIPRSKVRVVYNGVNKRFFYSRPTTSDLELPESYILYVGALSTRKNISGLLNAFRILKENYDIEHDLVLIGPEEDPTNKSGIDKKAIDPIRENILQLGYVTDEELKEAYTSADVFVFPSFYEGFGMPPLEAMACGTPVVASNRTAIPEILGDAPVYIDPADINSIANNTYQVIERSNLQERLVAKGYEQSRRYRWKRSAETVLEELLEIS